MPGRAGPGRGPRRPSAPRSSVAGQRVGGTGGPRGARRRVLDRATKDGSQPTGAQPGDWDGRRPLSRQPHPPWPAAARPVPPGHPPKPKRRGSGSLTQIPSDRISQNGERERKKNPPHRDVQPLQSENSARSSTRHHRLLLRLRLLPRRTRSGCSGDGGGGSRGGGGSGCGGGGSASRPLRREGGGGRERFGHALGRRSQ